MHSPQHTHLQAERSWWLRSHCPGCWPWKTNDSGKETSVTCDPIVVKKNNSNAAMTQENKPCRAHKCSQDRQREPVAHHRNQPPTCCSPGLAGRAALCWAWTQDFLQRAPAWTCHERWWPSLPEMSPAGPAPVQALLRRGRQPLVWQPWEICVIYLLEEKGRKLVLSNIYKEVNYNLMCKSSWCVFSKWSDCFGTSKPYVLKYILLNIYHH